MKGTPSLTTRDAILALAGGFAALAIIVLILFGWRDYRHVENTAMANAASLAAMLETDIERAITVTDRLLTDLQQHLELDLRAGLGVFEGDGGDLVHAAHVLPVEGTVWFADTDGKIRLSSMNGNVAGIDVADREYFSAHRNGATFFLSRMTKGKASGKINWFASRRVNGPDGSFAGVVVAALDLGGSYQSMFQVANLGTDAMLAVLREDGGMVMRYPISDAILAKSLSKIRHPPEIGDGVTGSYRRASFLDGVDRLRVWRRMQAYPLIIVVGVAALNLEITWIQHMVVGTALLVLMLTPLLLFARSALALARREEDQRDHLEDIVAERTRALSQAIDAKDRFLASASHDLRQPMQAIRLLTDVLRASDLDAARQRMVWPHLDRAIKAGETLLSSLLEVSSLDAATSPPRLEEVAVSPLLAELVELHRLTAEGKGVGLDFVPSRQVVITDPALLRQILANLVGNAVRYTERGRILVGCRRAGPNVRIEVWDTGIGIPEDKLGEVFEDFVQLGNAERDRTKGLGLGLGIVRRAAQLLGHRLAVRSRPGCGSVFSVELPRAPDAEAASAPAVRLLAVG